ncbi:MAG: CRISPR-associated endonuclease Cas2 [Lachnospiraceae bacterium]|nr:CRISPR-associated endonuclease Cas2 [Lachnospiraceae bacterium]
MEEYCFEVSQNVNQDHVFVLVIYDIVDNKVRNQLVKCLQGYGFRVQKSAFEAVISKKSYRKLLKELPAYIKGDDSIKVYKIIGSGQVTSFGKTMEIETENIIIV